MRDHIFSRASSLWEDVRIVGVASLLLLMLWRYAVVWRCGGVQRCVEVCRRRRGMQKV